MKLLDIQTTADCLGVSRQTINRMIESGALAAIPIRSGRRKTILRIPDHALRKFLNLKPSEALEPAIVAAPKKKPAQKDNRSDTEKDEGERLNA